MRERRPFSQADTDVAEQHALGVRLVVVQDDGVRAAVGHQPAPAERQIQHLAADTATEPPLRELARLGFQL